jgi:hypothetical protein
MDTQQETSKKNKGKDTQAENQKEINAQALEKRIQELENQVGNIWKVAQDKVNQLNQEIERLETEKKTLEEDKQTHGEQSEVDRKAIEATHNSLDNIEAVMVEMREFFK